MSSLYVDIWNQCDVVNRVCCAVFSRSVVSDSLRESSWTRAFQAPLSVGILQARILEWVAMPFSRGSSQPRDWAQVSCIAGGFFTVWATRKSKNTGVGNLSLLPGNFLTRNWTGVSCIADRFFTSWATREAQNYTSFKKIKYLFTSKLQINSYVSLYKEGRGEFLGSPVVKTPWFQCWGPGSRGKERKRKKTLQLKKKKFPLATGTICSGLCLWDSRESVASGREWCPGLVLSTAQAAVSRIWHCNSGVLTTLVLGRVCFLFLIVQF